MRTSIGCDETIANWFRKLAGDLTHNAFLRRLLIVWEATLPELRDQYIRQKGQTDDPRTDA